MSTGSYVDENAEATHSYVRAAPGRVFTRLVRWADDGTLVRGMYVEFTPAQALRMSHQLAECAKLAIATDETPHYSNNMLNQLLETPA